MYSICLIRSLYLPGLRAVLLEKFVRARRMFTPFQLVCPCVAAVMVSSMLPTIAFAGIGEGPACESVVTQKGETLTAQGHGGCTTAKSSLASSSEVPWAKANAVP